MSGHVPPPPMSPPPGGGYPPQGPPSGPPPGGPPYGGPPYGGPPYGGPPYGGQPPGWGGQPPYGQPGPGGPGGGGSRRGLWIGLGVLALVLVVGVGTAIGFVVSGDDDGDGDDTARDDNTSAPADPSTPAESDSPTEPEEPEPSPVEPTETEPAEGTGTPFTAEYGSDVGDVCDGGAMSNAAAYDPASPKISPFKQLPGNDLWLSQYVPSDKPYYVDYEDFEKVSVVACLTPGEPADQVKCESTDADDKPITYTYVTVPYSLRFAEAATGRDLGTAPDLEAPEASCPFIAFIEDGRAYSSIDDEALQAAIAAHEFA
ncbi:hypothetical protein [Nocardioides dongxiaopingii]|uniref:hypothetical protein n=1 Tax=Nocardioides sp. S-1144 TaxID=2582905 RepID=UPI001652A842|nr:hypothetical protein [Nocardioides sp. S-1144]